MAKKITINEKLLGKIRIVFTHKLSLNNIEEFEEMEGRKLFEDRPEHWTQIENVLCEYTNRIQTEIMNDIKNLLENGNAR